MNKNKPINTQAKKNTVLADKNPFKIRLLIFILPVLFLTGSDENIFCESTAVDANNNHPIACITKADFDILAVDMPNIQTVTPLYKKARLTPVKSISLT